LCFEKNILKKGGDERGKICRRKGVKKSNGAI
jgi:hypothetical protein